MATEQESQRTKQIADIKRELQRRALDQLKVKNPLDKPFSTIFDGFTHIVESKKERVFPRYIAEKWMREHIDHRINMDAQDAIAKENEKRLAKGWKELNLYEETLDFISGQNLYTSNPELRGKYLKEIYRGVSEEHGLDIPVAVAEPKDTRPLDQRLLEELDAELGTELPEDTEEDASVAKDALLKEIE